MVVELVVSHIIIYNSGHEFFPGLRNGCKSPFFVVSGGLFRTIKSNFICSFLGLKPCSTIWTMFREPRSAPKREYGDSSLKTVMDYF